MNDLSDRQSATTQTGSPKPSVSTGGAEQSSSIKKTSSSTLSKVTSAISVTLKPLFEIWNELRPELLDRGTTPKIPIGLHDLDEVLWGLHRKQVLVVAARPGQGKSAFVCHLAVAMADQNLRVLFFANEMSREQIVERLFTNVCTVDNDALRKGRAKDRVLVDGDVFFRWAESVKILVDDENGLTIDGVTQVCEIIKPDVVIVDYVQMISSIGFRSKLEAIENYVQQFKLLSKHKNFCGILVSQINRDGADKPDMNKLKGSGVLEEHPDTVMTLKWDWSNKDNPRYVANVEKQRHGVVRNNIDLQFQPEYSKFSNAEKPSDYSKYVPKGEPDDSRLF